MLKIEFKLEKREVATARKHTKDSENEIAKKRGGVS